jgi:hypothetical protein
MAKHGSKNDVGSTFHDVISAMHPSARFSSFHAKRMTTNTRVLLPAEAGAAGDEKGVVLKLKKVTMAVIPHNKFVPLVMSTQKRGTVMMGARLSPHGGEIAVELARRLARKDAMRLVVLGTNIIVFCLLDAASVATRSSNGSVSNLGAGIGGRLFIEESMGKIRKIAEEFHTRIDALLA